MILIDPIGPEFRGVTGPHRTRQRATAFSPRGASRAGSSHGSRFAPGP